MAKKPNPWVRAREKKKKESPVDLHPDVLRAVLRMNPALRGGDRSTEEVGQALVEDLPPSDSTSPPADQSDGQFRIIFGELLSELSERMGGELRELDRRRRAIDDEERALREAYVGRIVDFLVEVKPGPLSEATREILRSHGDFIHRLKVELSELNRRVRQRGGGGQ